MISLLSILLLIPLGDGALLLLFAGVSTQRSARWIALGGSAASLAVSLALLADYRDLVAGQRAAAATEQITAPQDSPIRPRVQYRQPWLTIGGDATGQGGATLEFHLGL